MAEVGESWMVGCAEEPHSDSLPQGERRDGDPEYEEWRLWGWSGVGCPEVPLLPDRVRDRLCSLPQERD